METASESTAPVNATTIVEKQIRYQILMALMRTLADEGDISPITIERAQQLSATVCGFDCSSIFIN